MGAKPKITLGQFKRQIKAAIIGQERYNISYAPILGEGPSGVGKSQAVKQVFYEVQEELKDIVKEPWGWVDMRFAGKTASDIQGIPYPKEILEPGENTPTRVMGWLMDEYFPGVLKSSPKHGIFFADELTQVSNPAVKSLLYQFMLDHRLQSLLLDRGWHIVSAGNREEDGGVYDRLSAPLRNRLSIFDIKFSKTEWLSWARDFGMAPAISTFVDLGVDNKEVCMTYDNEAEELDDPNGTNYVFASPRSYEFCNEKIKLYEKATAQSIGTPYEQDDLMISFQSIIGEDLGRHLADTYFATKSIDISSIINASWSNGSPSIQLDPLQSATTGRYLTNLAYKPKDEDAFKSSSKILMYLLYRDNDSANNSLIYNSYTAEQKEQFSEQLKQTTSIKLFNKLSLVRSDVSASYERG